jgi:hypothetical protein
MNPDTQWLKTSGISIGAKIYKPDEAMRSVKTVILARVNLMSEISAICSDKYPNVAHVVTFADILS